MTEVDSKPRVSAATIVGVDIPTSRVRFRVDNMGLNREYIEAQNAVKELKKSEEGLSALAEQHATIVNQCLALKKEELYQHQVKLTELEQNKDNMEPSKYAKDHTRLLAQCEANQKHVDAWEKEDEYEQARIALQSAKYRISHRAEVALATIADDIAHEFGLHAVRRTFAEGRRNIMNRYMAKDVDSLSLYSLVSPLESFQNFLHFTRTHEELDLVKDLCKTEENKITTNSNVTRKEKLLEDLERYSVHHKEDVESNDNDNNDVVAVENKDNNPRTLGFVHYVSKIVKKHIYTDDNNNTATRVTNEFCTLVSGLLCELISVRVTNLLRILLRVKNAKTVSDEHVCAVLEMMMTDSPQRGDPKELLARVKNNVESWSGYLDESKNGDVDVDSYVARNVRQHEVPEPPQNAQAPHPSTKKVKETKPKSEKSTDTDKLKNTKTSKGGLKVLDNTDTDKLKNTKTSKGVLRVHDDTNTGTPSKPSKSSKSTKSSKHSKSTSKSSESSAVDGSGKKRSKLDKLNDKLNKASS